MPSSRMKLVVVGAAGRMGRALVRAISESPSLVLHGAVEREGSPMLGQDSGVLAGVSPNSIPINADARGTFAGADGVIDFTSPASTLIFGEMAAEFGLVHIVGTTGMSEGDLRKLEAFASRSVLVRSGNFSFGVNLLAALVRRAAASLGPDWDIEISEMHHRLKVDAPSGTALLLGEAAAAGREIPLTGHSVRSRDGHTGVRPQGAIGFQSLRGGSVIGDHTVIFAGSGERLELRHVAEDRSLFATGAVKAALWAHGKAPGIYTMDDILGLKG